MKKRYFYLSLLVALVAGGLIVSGVLAFNSHTDNKYREGFVDGQVQGRRDVVDAILINVANEGNVVIRQGDQSLTLVLEGRVSETPTPTP